jgi:hypothetical protein
LACA